LSVGKSIKVQYLTLPDPKCHEIFINKSFFCDIFVTMSEKPNNSKHIAPTGDTSDGGAYLHVATMAKVAAAGVYGCVKFAATPAIPPHPVTKGGACIAGFVVGSGIGVITTAAAIQAWDSVGKPLLDKGEQFFAKHHPAHAPTPSQSTPVVTSTRHTKAIT
jgi:hypothetical protein